MGHIKVQAEKICFVGNFMLCIWQFLSKVKPKPKQSSFSFLNHGTTNTEPISGFGFHMRWQSLEGNKEKNKVGTLKK